MKEREIAYPIRATYGEVNRGHGLRYCSGPAEILPSKLLDLTDKPPGHTPPGEIWGPAVGCAPVGEWWALWWTDSDKKASRAGMAISQVALWPLTDAANIDDLGLQLRALSGGKEIIRPSESIVAAVAEMLIDQGGQISVFGDLELWPGLLTALWQQLWPEARMSFSARVAISPPQHGMSVAPPLIYGVAKGRIAEWNNHPIVRPETVHNVPRSRAVRWLIGEPDSTIDRLVSCNSELGPTLAVLKRIARAADRLDTIRENPDPTNAVDLLRTLESLADGGAAYKEFQYEAERALLGTLHEAPPTVILSLANIQISNFSEGIGIERGLENWIQSELAGVPFSTADQLLTRLEQGGAAPWWIKAAISGISKGIKSHNINWMSFLFSWLCKKSPPTLLQSIGVIDSEIEDALLKIAATKRLTPISEPNLTRNAEIFGWSKLYAIGILELTTPSEAVRLQMQFKNNNLQGLEFLVTLISAKDLVNLTLSTTDEKLIGLVISRTIREPSLVCDMDLALVQWRRFWGAHVLAGGDAWPSPVKIDTQARKFLVNVASGEKPPGVVNRLVEIFGPIALDLPDRAHLWQRLEHSDASTLGNLVAKLILHKCDLNDTFDIPEAFILSRMDLAAESVSLSARQASYLLEWDPYISESGASAKIRSITRWGLGSERLGRLVHERRWRMIADWLASSYRLGNSEVLSAVHACYDLLGFFSSFGIPPPKGSVLPTLDNNSLAAEVASIGADIAHDRLEEIWIRAGGKAAQLSVNSTPADRWRKACNQANSGMLPENLLSLVRELLREFYNNDRLRILEQVLRK